MHDDQKPKNNPQPNATSSRESEAADVPDSEIKEMIGKSITGLRALTELWNDTAIIPDEDCAPLNSRTPQRLKLLAIEHLARIESIDENALRDRMDAITDFVELAISNPNQPRISIIDRAIKTKEGEPETMTKIFALAFEALNGGKPVTTRADASLSLLSLVAALGLQHLLKKVNERKEKAAGAPKNIAERAKEMMAAVAAADHVLDEGSISEIRSALAIN